MRRQRERKDRKNGNNIGGAIGIDGKER